MYWIVLWVRHKYKIKLIYYTSIFYCNRWNKKSNIYDTNDYTLTNQNISLIKSETKYSNLKANIFFIPLILNKTKKQLSNPTIRNNKFKSIYKSCRFLFNCIFVCDTIFPTLPNLKFIFKWYNCIVTISFRFLIKI